MLDVADAVAINKFERRGAEDALREVRRQVARTRGITGDLEALPVFGTIASRFNDDGITALYQHLRSSLEAHGLRGRSRARSRRLPRTPPPRSPRSFPSPVGATWPRWPRPCGDTTSTPRRRSRRCAASNSSTRWPSVLSAAGRPIDDVAALLEPARAAVDPACAELVDGYLADDLPRFSGPDRPTRTTLSDTVVPAHRAAAHLRARRAAALPAGRAPPGPVPVHRRRPRPAQRHRGPDPDVRGGGRPGEDQRPVPLPRGGPAGHPPVGRVRLGHALRRRPRRGPRRLRQGRQLGRVDRHRRRHARPVRRLRPDRPHDLGVDDHQRSRSSDPRDVPVRGDRPAPRARPGRGAPSDPGHGAGRHPEGGAGAEHLHPLVRTGAADDDRHPVLVHRPRGPALLQRVHLGLPHRRSGREPHLAVGLHAGQRLHLPRGVPGRRPGHRRRRPEPQLLLLERDGCRVHGARPGRPTDLGDRAAGPLRSVGPQPAAQVPRADLRPVPARAGDVVQRHPHHAAGALRDLRQRELAAHQRLRRGDHHPHRRVGAPGHGDPAGDQPRVGRHHERQPAAGLVPGRGAHRSRRGGRAGRARAHQLARRRSRRDGDRATSAAGSRTSRCATSSASTTARCRSSA